MNDKNLKRLIRLAQRTGDRLIVAGEGNEEPMVIMGVGEYEAMIDLLMERHDHHQDEDGDFSDYDEMDEIDEIQPVGAFHEMPTNHEIPQDDDIDHDNEDDFDLPESIFAPMPGESPEEPGREFVLEEMVSEQKEVEKRDIQPSESAGYDNEEQFYLEPIE